MTTLGNQGNTKLVLRNETAKPRVKVLAEISNPPVAAKKSGPKDFAPMLAPFRSLPEIRNKDAIGEPLNEMNEREELQFTETSDPELLHEGFRMFGSLMSDMEQILRRQVTETEDISGPPEVGGERPQQERDLASHEAAHAGKATLATNVVPFPTRKFAEMELRRVADASTTAAVDEARHLLSKQDTASERQPPPDEIAVAEKPAVSPSHPVIAEKSSATPSLPAVAENTAHARPMEQVVTQVTDHVQSYSGTATATMMELISHARTAAQVFKLTLKPEGLGHVEVAIATRGGRTEIRLVSSSRETQSLLENDSGVLLDGLVASGLARDQVVVRIETLDSSNSFGTAAEQTGRDATFAGRDGDRGSGAPRRNDVHASAGRSDDEILSQSDLAPSTETSIRHRGAVYL